MSSSGATPPQQRSKSWGWRREERKLQLYIFSVKSHISLGGGNLHSCMRWSSMQDLERFATPSTTHASTRSMLLLSVGRRRASPTRG